MTDETVLKRKTGNFGGARRDRTADLLHAMQALSQLSYSPENYSLEINRFEPEIKAKRILAVSTPLSTRFIKLLSQSVNMINMSSMNRMISG